MDHSQSVDLKRRKVLLQTTSTIAGVGVGFAAYPFLASWQPNARAVAAGAPVEVNIGSLEEGQLLITQWRGRPIWILKRNQQMIESLNQVESEDVLRDISSTESEQPSFATNQIRSIRPEIFVAIGVCTHLGCSPTYRPLKGSEDLGPDWKGGFFCPCHGSKFDYSGRVYKSVPAPTNLSIPPYFFADDSTIVVGVDQT